MVDLASDKESYPFLVKSAQDETHAEGPEEVNRISKATSMRQNVEWGMRMFQWTYPHMKNRFIYKERGERKPMILLTIILFNLRTKIDALNKIRTVFIHFLSVEAQYFLRERLSF